MEVSRIEDLKTSKTNVAITDTSGSVIYTNMSGLPTVLFDVLSPEGQAELNAVLSGMPSSGRIASSLFADFSAVSVKPLEGAGAIVYFFCDATENRINITQDLLEQISEGFYALDASYRFTYMNEKAKQELNLYGIDVIGQNFWDIFPALADSNYALQYIQALETRQTASFEEYFSPLAAWYQVNIYPQTDGGLFVFFYNINLSKKTELHLWESKHLDALTGLFNRKTVYDHLQILIFEKEPFTLFHLNLNNLQLINDVYGHDTGNKVITELGSRLASSLPHGDVLGRIGGDEFIIAAVEPMSDSEKTAYASRLLDQVDQPFISRSNDRIELRASVGVASHPEDGSSADELLKAADTALFKAKTIYGDKSAIVLFEQALEQDMKRRMMIDRDISAALKNGDFFTVYHPQIAIDSGAIAGVEVLSRWNHPELGLIPPPEFIAVVESIGKSSLFTQAVIQAGLEDYSKWVEECNYSGRISFNIPPSIISCPAFFEELCRLKQKYNVPDGFIELEITENANLTSSPEKRTSLAALRKAGFWISIDDFGTGFSSLDYLIDFPIDEIKIDKTFIKQINTSEKGCVILQKMIDLGNDLNLQVIAEGVENEFELHYLKRAGCCFVQGYLFDRPMPNKGFLTRLKKVQS